MAERFIAVAETQLFVRRAKEVWNEAEREEFVLYIAGNPEVGSVIADTGGVRKVRWGRAGSGKRGGIRVIYLSRSGSAALFVDGLREGPARRSGPGRKADGA